MYLPGVKGLLKRFKQSFLKTILLYCWSTSFMTQINAMFGNTCGDGSTDLQQMTKQAHRKTFVKSMQVTKKISAALCAHSYKGKRYIINVKI